MKKKKGKIDNYKLTYHPKLRHIKIVNIFGAGVYCIDFNIIN